MASSPPDCGGNLWPLTENLDFVVDFADSVLLVSPRKIVRVALLQNETAPEKLEFQYHKVSGTTNAKNDPKSDPKRVLKMFKPLSVHA